MYLSNYQDLKVWQKSIKLVVEVYRLLRLLPKEEMFALSSQMRRSAISIPSNIAEGQQRQSPKDFIRFLFIARGSNAELQTQLIICHELQYFSTEDSAVAMQLSVEIGKMLNTLINRLSLLIR